MSDETVRRIDRSYELGKAQETPEGYIFAHGTVAHPGVLRYRGKDGKIIRELISDEDLAEPASVESLKRKVLTLDHPKDDVNSRNYQALSTGDVGSDADIAEDGSLQSGIYAKRADATAAIRSGIRGLSAGYTCKIDKTPGVHPIYGEYDQRQYARRYNHVAIVTKGKPRAERTFLRYDGDAFEVENDDSITNEEIEMPSDQPSEQPAVPATVETPQPKGEELKPALNSELATQLGLSDSSPEAIKAAVAKLQDEPRQDSTQRELEMIAYANKRAPLLNLAKRHGVEVTDKMANDELLKQVALKISPAIARRTDSMSSDYYQAVVDLHGDDKLSQLKQPTRKPPEKRTDAKEETEASVRDSQIAAAKEANQKLMKQYSK